MLLYATSRIGL